jgi:hypothetical protein
MEIKMRKLPMPIILAIAGVLMIFALQFPAYVFGLSGADPGMLMQVIVSLAVLGGSLLVVLSKKYQSVEKHWAFGVIGTIVGFWLRTPH